VLAVACNGGQGIYTSFTSQPSSQPTSQPSSQPSQPTRQPTSSPTANPTLRNANDPTITISKSATVFTSTFDNVTVSFTNLVSYTSFASLLCIVTNIFIILYREEVYNIIHCF